METISAHGTGTYGILGDNLVISITALDVSVDGEGFVEFFTQVARDFARYCSRLARNPRRELLSL